MKQLFSSQIFRGFLDACNIMKQKQEKRIKRMCFIIQKTDEMFFLGVVNSDFVSEPSITITQLMVFNLEKQKIKGKKCEVINLQKWSLKSHINFISTFFLASKNDSNLSKSDKNTQSILKRLKQCFKKLPYFSHVALYNLLIQAIFQPRVQQQNT